MPPGLLMDSVENLIEDYTRKLKGVHADWQVSWIFPNVLDITRVFVVTDNNKGYILTLYPSLECTCNCPDYLFRRRFCKHIYWFGFRFFNQIDPHLWTNEMKTKFLNNNYFNMNVKTGRNNECPVCLEHIDYETDKTLCCVSQCFNSVHYNCWKQYTNTIATERCIVCRTESMPSYYKCT